MYKRTHWLFSLVFLCSRGIVQSCLATNGNHQSQQVYILSEASLDALEHRHDYASFVCLAFNEML